MGSMSRFAVRLRGLGHIRSAADIASSYDRPWRHIASISGCGSVTQSDCVVTQHNFDDVNPGQKAAH